MSLLDWIYPPKCVACRIIFDPVHNKPRPWLCDNCRPLLTLVPMPVCPKCGHPRNFGDTPASHFSHSCLSCQTRQFHFKSHRACYIYSDVIRDMIHDIKFRSQRHIAQGLGHLLAEAFQDADITADYILPVPLHPSKKRSRGFNQATILSRPLSVSLGIPLVEKMIKRIKKTLPQSGLSVPSREQNLSQAFTYSGKKYSAANKSILIIDDIFTSGATMNTCAKLLIEHGAREVNCLSLSIAVKDFDDPNSVKF